MTNANDLIFVPFALQMIDDNGTDVVFTVTDETYNRTTGDMTVNNPPVPVTRKISPPSRVTEEMVDGDIVHVSDMTCLVAASGLTLPSGMPWVPERLQTLVWNSKTWTIQMVSPIASGDDIAAYKLVLRSN